MKFNRRLLILEGEQLSSNSFKLECMEVGTGTLYFLLGISPEPEKVCDTLVNDIQALDECREYEYIIGKIKTQYINVPDFRDVFIEMGKLVARDENISIKVKRNMLKYIYRYTQYLMKQYNSYTSKTVDVYNGKRFLNDLRVAISVFELEFKDKKEIYRIMDYLWKEVIKNKAA